MQTRRAVKCYFIVLLNTVALQVRPSVQLLTGLPFRVHS